MTRCVRLWGVNCPAAVCRREFFLGGGAGYRPFVAIRPARGAISPLGRYAPLFFVWWVTTGGWLKKGVMSKSGAMTRQKAKLECRSDM